MKILSIDPGIKHLAFCYLSVIESQIDIIDWDNLCITESNCKKISFEFLIENLLETLALNFDDSFEADVVLIENQPLNNIQMKSVSVAIYTYFNIMRMQFGNIKKVQFMKATEKLKCSKLKELPETTTKTSYKDRKKTGIELCRLYLKAICPEKLDWFEGLSKKDDKADTFDMIMYYIENIMKFKI